MECAPRRRRSAMDYRGGASATFRASRTWLRHRSDVEPERPQLLAAVVGDLVRAPRGHPDPVDRDVADEALEGRLGLVGDHVGHVVDGHRRRAAARSGLGHVGQVAVVDALGVGHEGAPSDWAWAVASFHAIQESNAHFTRAGNLATPAKAMPSSRTSSSGSTCPLPCMSSRNVWWICIASSTGLPITRSVSTEADACEMEQPTES